MKNITLYRKIITLTLTIALLFNAVSSLNFSFNVASADSGVRSLFGDKILICTSSGLKYISFEDFKKGDYPKDKSTRSHCPLCIVNNASDDNFTLTATKTKSLPISVAKTRYSQTLKVVFRHEATNNIQPRASPYFL